MEEHFQCRRKKTQRNDGGEENGGFRKKEGKIAFWGGN